MIHRPMYLEVLSLDLLKNARDLELDNQLEAVKHLEKLDNRWNTPDKVLIEVENRIKESKEMMVAYDVLINAKIKEEQDLKRVIIKQKIK